MAHSNQVRDFRTWMVRVRSPLSSRLDSRNQLSISDETPTSESATLAWVSEVRLVNSAVVPSSFRKSIRRIRLGLSDVSFVSMVRLLMGSTTTTLGFNRLTMS